MIRGAFLHVTVENAEFWLPAMIRAVASEALEEPAQIHQLATLFRQRGAAAMFREGVVTPFQIGAMQSCAAFVHGLNQWPQATQVSSWANPLLDALACGYWEGARAIAQASRDQWNPDYEYEDDFQFVRFLLEYGALEDETAAASTLERYAEVLGGPPDARLELCTALLEQDPELFDEALTRRLEERDESIRELILEDLIRDDAARWIAYLSTEGLALLRLASRAGLPTQPHYLHCPALARVQSPYRYDPDAWRVLHYRPSS